MLINVTHDKDFQRYLDRVEQRLHVEMVPLLSVGIRTQVIDGGVPAHTLITRRGGKILVKHYKKIFREVYGRVPPIQKADDNVGINGFMSRMLSYLETEAATRIQYISQSLADQVRTLLLDAVERGLSSNEIAAEIYDMSPDISRNRSATIARTETHGAALWAMDETIDEKEIPIQYKTWWTAGDARVRPSHAAMHGVELPRDEPFDLDGGQLMYPGDDSMGADEGEIINCRCSVLYNTGESSLI